MRGPLIGVPVLGLTVTTAAVIAVLGIFDGFLAKTETMEVRGEASRAYREGSERLNRGDAEGAVAPLRQAWVLERGNTDYELQLSNALTRTGKLSESEALLTEAISHEPRDGAANLAAARLNVRKGDIPEAISYFHRAIFGEWKSNPLPSRIAARLELVEFLAEQKRHQEMLSELISLDAESGGQDSVRRRLARFYMVAGSPNRAATVYQELELKDPADPAVLIGLGDAEIGRGQYRAARTAFVRAAMHSPKEPLDSRLQLVDQLTALDPTPRQLASEEKYKRSRLLLEMARNDLEQRENSNQIAVSTEAQKLMKQATEALAKRAPSHVNNEMAEANLTIVESLWRLRLKLYGPDLTQDEQPLRLVVDKLTN
jgi:Flp pilus assembly protein TadD